MRLRAGKPSICRRSQVGKSCDSDLYLSVDAVLYAWCKLGVANHLGMCSQGGSWGKDPDVQDHQSGVCDRLVVFNGKGTAPPG